MAMRPVLQWELFPANGEDHKLSQQKLLYAYEAMCRANQEYLRAYPQTPLIYESGVRYRQEPAGHEDWADIPNVISQGWGDCEDLGAWTVAELRERFKIPAKPFLRWRRRDNEYHYHAILILPAAWRTEWEIMKVPAGPQLPTTMVQVLEPNGLPKLRKVRNAIFDKPGGGFVFEDPSARLGMYGGQLNISGAYQDIERKAQDPQKLVAAVTSGPQRSVPLLPTGMPYPVAMGLIRQARARRRRLLGV